MTIHKLVELSVRQIQPLRNGFLKTVDIFDNVELSKCALHVLSINSNYAVRNRVDEAHRFADEDRLNC